MPLNYSKWDNIELSDDEDNFHPNIDNNLMIRLQREKRQQREVEEATRRKELEGKIEKGEDADAASEELAKLDRLQKLHVGNICTDKFSSKCGWPPLFRVAAITATARPLKEDARAPESVQGVCSR